MAILLNHSNPVLLSKLGDWFLYETQHGLRWVKHFILLVKISSLFESQDYDSKREVLVKRPNIVALENLLVASSEKLQHVERKKI